MDDRRGHGTPLIVVVEFERPGPTQSFQGTDASIAVIVATPEEQVTDCCGGRYVCAKVYNTLG